MRSLSIGNSFSQDAYGYLHQIAASLGIEWECVNLYIGGCSLEYHAENLRENRANYDLQINSASVGKQVSIREALCEMGEFDLITLQQASHFSGKPETYFPYIKELYDICRETQPNAKIVIHETWAYEIDADHGAFPDYNRDQRYMYECLRDAYTRAAEELGVDIIPCGDAVQYVRENVPEFDYKNGGLSLNKDGFHMSRHIGRCLLAYVWIEKILGADVTKSQFIPEDADETTAQLITLVRNTVHNLMTD